MQSISGPTLTVLADHVCESPTTVGWIFTARSVGFLIGSLIPAYVEKLNWDQMLLLTASLVICGVTIGVVPIITALWEGFFINYRLLGKFKHNLRGLYGLWRI